LVPIVFFGPFSYLTINLKKQIKKGLSQFLLKNLGQKAFLKGTGKEIGFWKIETRI